MPDPRRQVQQHLDALKNAGVEFVSTSAPIPAASPADGPEPVILPVGQGGRPPERPGTSAPAPVASPITVPAASSLFDVPSDVPTSPKERQTALQLMIAEVAKCDRCPELFSTRNKTVFGEGPVGADVCFVGEAPGADEDRQGRPFVGVSGQLLDKIIAAMGLKRGEVYICNTIKCRPPGNRDPLPAETLNCRGYFEQQIALVGPKYIVCLGRVAAQNVLKSKASLSKLRGSFHDYKGIPVLCTLHPAYLLRYPESKKDCWDDMKTLLRKMGRPVPGPGGK